MDALNRAFDKAFAHSEGDDNINELLACMGSEMGCERISIFEENEEGTSDNTYEWCQDGIVREQVFLQHISVFGFGSWHDRLVREGIIVIHDPEELKESDPFVYKIFLELGIRTAMVCLLAFHGRNFGFCILENPAAKVMEDWEQVMPGIRYILSSLIYSQSLVMRLRRIGYTDSLTGVGNRVSLREHLERIDRSKPVGVISIDVIGWDDAEGKLMHLEKEQTLLRAGEILTDLFDVDHVFRVSTGEFVLVENEPERESFEANLRRIRGLFREFNLLSAMAAAWREPFFGSMDAFIQEVHEKTDEEKRVLLEHRGKTSPNHAARATGEEGANIDLPKGDAFFRIAERFLSGLFEEAVVSIVTDINFFNLYNDIFGRKAGNIFLENIAKTVGEIAEKYHGVCGYIGGDNFCLILPTMKKDYRELLPIIREHYNSVKFPDGFAPAVGAYYSDDRRESMIAIYDRALAALSEIKGDYMEHIHFYSAERHRHHKENKLLLMNVKEGLRKGEFVFYVQPQVRDRTGEIIGGEALVRWFHDGQMVSPGQFIPILEQTGYVYAVDSYVWESVAKWQRSLLDRGISPVPVSVNVSRVDFYFDDIAEHFIRLIKEYDLDPGLIGVEITESAFTENLDTIMDSVSRLHEAGFHVLMDDFGSGSSSLSMLHTMNLDVLKTDVRFMSKDNMDVRAISIVESIVSMAHMIGMSVVTEGVETEEQKDNLIAIGDNYAQGFYFYKPMPKEQFEELIRNQGSVNAGFKKTFFRADSRLRFKEMIQEGYVSETLLENIIRAAAIFKEEDGQIVLLQLNERFATATGILPGEEDALTNRLDEENMAELKHLIHKANAHPLGGSEGRLCINNEAGQPVPFFTRVFLLYTFGNHRLYLSTVGSPGS